MATVITRTLKASGGDYSSIKSWLSDMLTLFPDLVTLDVILELQCYNDWPSGLDETFVDFSSGFTTDADHKFRIVAADGEGHTGVAGTGFWFNSTTTSLVLYSRSKHVVFDGIELSAPNSGQTMIGASSNTIVKNCILHDINSAGFSTTSGAEFENCIMYLTAPSSSSNDGKAAQNAKLTNVTAYISEDSGAFNGDIVFQGCECTNVYMYHNRAKTSYDSFFGCTGDYNVALAINGDIPGANSFFITDDSDLEDPDNFDFRLKSTSPLMTAGENGGPIGAVFASEQSGGNNSTIDVSLPALSFSATASATLPNPASSISFEQLTPLFSIDSIATLPSPTSNASYEVNAPSFSAASSATLPKPVSSIGIELFSPVFNIESNATLPSSVASVLLDLPRPIFSIDSINTLPAPSSSTEFDIGSPVFSIEVSVTTPNGQALIGFNVDSPLFSAVSSATLPKPISSIEVSTLSPSFNVQAEVSRTLASSDININVEQPVFAAQSSVTLPSPMSAINTQVQAVQFSVTIQVSGLDIVTPKTGATMSYEIGSNKLIYSAKQNKLNYIIGSNKLTY